MGIVSPGPSQQRGLCVRLTDLATNDLDAIAVYRKGRIPLRLVVGPTETRRATVRPSLETPAVRPPR